jgi:photosystem II stability/assembly factor-like uncharacterized protein
MKHFFNTPLKKTKLLFGAVSLFLISFSNVIAQSWDYKDSGTDFILLDLSIPPGQDQVAYAAGSQYTVDSAGIIIKTIDGGETWETIYPLTGSVSSFTRIEFITSLKGFAVGWANTFMITEDGGETWEDVVAGTNMYFYSSLNFYDENIGFAAGLNLSNGLDSYITNDGGLTWALGTSTANMAEFSSAYADENTLFSVGKDQVISKSSDGGENWSMISSGIQGYYNFEVFFKDVANGIVSTEDGTLLTTHDSGATWETFSTGYHNFYGLNYIGDKVFAAGTDEDVFYSSDNGSTWSLVHDGPPTATFYAIDFFSNGDALICGSQGTILKASELILGTSNFEATSPTVYYTSSTKKLNINSELDFTSYSIYSIDGKLVKEGKLNSTNNLSIDVSYIANGNYILILNNNDTSKSIKFFKY